jgi:hypothetical protein
MVTVTVTTSPALRVLLNAPVALEITTLLTVGAKVSESSFLALLDRKSVV